MNNFTYLISNNCILLPHVHEHDVYSVKDSCLNLVCVSTNTYAANFEESFNIIFVNLTYKI